MFLSGYRIRGLLRVDSLARRIRELCVGIRVVKVHRIETRFSEDQSSRPQVRLILGYSASPLLRLTVFGCQLTAVQYGTRRFQCSLAVQDTRWLSQLWPLHLCVLRTASAIGDLMPERQLCPPQLHLVAGSRSSRRTILNLLHVPGTCNCILYRPEAGSRFRFQGKMCSVPRFQLCQTCQFLVPALGHPLANMSHAGSSKFITKCRLFN